MSKKKEDKSSMSPDTDMHIHVDKKQAAGKSAFSGVKQSDHAAPVGSEAMSKDHKTASADTLKTKIASLEEALQASQDALQSQKEQYVKLYADMENRQRRHKIDLEKAHKYGLERMASDLIEVVDNLERAQDAFGESKESSLEGLREGVQLTLSQFILVLKKYGIQPIEAEGQPFDPEHHEAISMQQNEENPPNTVLKLIQKGYLINGRLLRAARVIVSTA